MRVQTCQQLVQCLAAIGSGRRLEAFHGEEHGHHLSNVGIIFDDKNRTRHKGGTLLPDASSTPSHSRGQNRPASVSASRIPVSYSVTMSTNRTNDLSGRFAHNARVG